MFIPSNHAFDDLPEEQRNDLDDDGYIRDLLQYHVVHGRHEKKDFHNEATFKSLRRRDDDDVSLPVRINIYKNNTVSHILTFI